MEIDYLECNDIFYYSDKYITNNLLEPRETRAHEMEMGACATIATENRFKIFERVNKRIGNVYTRIIGRHDQIRSIREYFRSYIEERKSIDPFYSDLESWSAYVAENGTYHMSSLMPVEDGISGTYFLADSYGTPQCVIKPFDEEAGCLNNPKSFHRITDNCSIRDYVSLYHSAMREVLAYQVALQVGVQTVAPKTVLAIIQAEQFHDYSQKMARGALPYYLHACGPIDQEKLCSVQEYVPNAQPLGHLIHHFEDIGLSNEEIAERFDQDDFEDVNILLWTTYDTDGHLWNFLTYPKMIDSLGREIFGIKKIDNGLSFPEKNRQLRNHLLLLNNAKRPLSPYGRMKIANIDVRALVEQCEIYGLENSIPALKERIVALQKIIQMPQITIEGINNALKCVLEWR